MIRDPYVSLVLFQRYQYPEYQITPSVCYFAFFTYYVKVYHCIRYNCLVPFEDLLLTPPTLSNIVSHTSSFRRDFSSVNTSSQDLSTQSVDVISSSCYVSCRNRFRDVPRFGPCNLHVVSPILPRSSTSPYQPRIQPRQQSWVQCLPLDDKYSSLNCNHEWKSLEQDTSDTSYLFFTNKRVINNFPCTLRTHVSHLQNKMFWFLSLVDIISSTTYCPIILT